MNALLVLILIQLAGIIFSIFISLLNLRISKRTILIEKNSRHINSNANDSWPWLIEYFQQYPLSELRKIFPDVYKIAVATKRYEELNYKYEQGAISLRKYEKGLKKILPLINLKPDLSEFRNNECS